MGAMEKKRLLPALIAAALTISGATASPAEEPSSIRGVRTEPGEAELSRARELLGKLKEPDMAQAEKPLSEIKRNFPAEKEPGEIMELLSVKPKPQAVFPEKNAASQKEEPELFYFFSFSMPRSSLREAARESAATGAVMVLRGLSGKNFGETASRISEVIGRTGAQVWIDPILFECFSVEAVPQLVLAYGHLPGADCEDLRHVKVSGDISSSLCPRAHGKGGRKCRDAFTGRLEKNGFYSMISLPASAGTFSAHAQGRISRRDLKREGFTATEILSRHSSTA